MMSFNWPLLRVWLRREVRSRYAGSAAGLLWAVAAPVVTVLLFYVLFAYIFQVRIPEIASQSGYFFYLLAGLLPWLTIHEGISRATSCIVAYEQFLQKQAFAVEILPLSVILAALVTQAVGTLLFLAMLIYAGLWQVQWLWLFPLALVCQVVMTVGLGFALAIVAYHFRDLLHAMPLLLQFFLYATPILYQISMVPEGYRFLVLLNPFAPVIMTYHAAFIGAAWPPVVALALVFWTLLLGVGGLWLFRVLKPTLGEAA